MRRGWVAVRNKGHRIREKGGENKRIDYFLNLCRI
jgi:hypothetical protein